MPPELGGWPNNTLGMLTFVSMVSADRGTQVRSFFGFLAICLLVAGCEDPRLTAILEAQAGAAGMPTDLPTPDSCSPGPAPLLPPMGWNGWNEFRCRPELGQAKFEANVDALVASGMEDAGYEYVNLDDCWQAPRGADGTLTANSRFPDGVDGLGRYAHARGLKLGVDAHNVDCPRPELTTPGSATHESQDAATFASWGVDYVKYVSCGGADADVETSFRTMRDALDHAARPMLLSIGNAPFKEWQPSVGQLWRTHGDIEPSWAALLDIIDTHSGLAAYGGRDGFNDADMLWVGNAALTDAESRAHFSMWSAFASPLLVGNDLSQMSDATAAILTNLDVIALDQDALTLQAVLLGQQGDVGVYAKPLGACGARGVVLLNRGTRAADASVTWQSLGLASGVAQVDDLWVGTALDPARDTLTLTVQPHDVRALRISGREPPLPSGNVYLSDLPWSYAANGWGPVELDQEVEGKASGDGKPLSLGGIVYDKGLGTNSPALVRYRLGKACHTLSADIGIDDSTSGGGSVVFQVWADREKIFDSGVMLGTTPPRARCVRSYRVAALRCRSRRRDSGSRRLGRRALELRLVRRDR